MTRLPPSLRGSGGTDSHGGCGQTIAVLIAAAFAVILAIALIEGWIKL